MFDTFILIIEIIGTIAFAISGAMIAIENKLDIFGVIVLGAVTATGGGLIRDIMIGNTPPLMFQDPLYFIIGISVSALVFLVFYLLKDLSLTKKRWYQELITISDALGLGVFIILGANVTIEKGFDNFFIVIFMSTITAVGGGLIRDLMAGKIPVIFRKHIYAVAAIITSILYFLLLKTNLNQIVSSIISIIFIVIVRYLAYYFKLSLPKVEIKEGEENGN